MPEIAILAIDQGTTSSRTIAFSQTGKILATAQKEFPQIYPKDGWVEHDPEEIWQTTLSTLRQVYKHVRADGYPVLGIGITNQRETTLVWDRKTGQPIYNAVVWQDRRTSKSCSKLKEVYDEDKLRHKTGLLFDPYFSATKIAWILDHVEGARERAKNGDLAFGTVDSFLIYRLTGGRSHLTDATNASRTNLFNIVSQNWDRELLDMFNIPANILPDVKDCAADFGHTDPELLGESLPILGVAGDQQAATIGQCCFVPGMIKSTYGTGCFVLLNTGQDVVVSKNRLLATVAYRLNGQATYALEGSIFIAGASVQWLRDELGLIETASDTEDLMKDHVRRDGVYVVPAFTGLGAPYWDPDARGAIFGLTRATNRSDLIRATLESVCFQTHDLFSAMNEDGVRPASLRVDGGMVANDWFVQTLSDIIDLPIERPVIMETTALGVAYLVALQLGLHDNLDALSETWQCEAEFSSSMSGAEREGLIQGWKTSVSKVLTG